MWHRVDADAVTSSELLRQADLAMYAAKEAGKNCYVHFRPEMLAALLERTQLDGRAAAAVDCGQITVHYQPSSPATGSRWCKFEALARWEWDGELIPPDAVHRDRGTQRPDPRDRRRGAAAQLHRAQPWLAEDPFRSLAVNVSGVQLQHRDFAELVLAIAACSGVDPRQLVLEVTESVFFDAHCHVIRQLVTLREAGIRVALDDFGTGYSSLGRLQDLPVDTLKIDKSFVSMMHTGDEKLPILHLHDPHGPQPGADRHRRGHRDPGAGPLPDGPWLRRPAGLPLFPPRTRGGPAPGHQKLPRGHRRPEGVPLPG